MTDQQKKLFIAGRTWGKSWSESVFMLAFLDACDVDFWLRSEISESDVEQYPNAKKAAELKKSKLYKAMR